MSLIQCSRCGQSAPPASRGPDGQPARGWVTYESQQTLIVDVPDPDDGGGINLPPNIAGLIGEFDGIVRLEVGLDGAGTVSETREVVSRFLGLACPDCQAETDWDDFEWEMFLTGLIA
jgi:hypothetical protein